MIGYWGNTISNVLPNYWWVESTKWIMDISGFGISIFLSIHIRRINVMLLPQLVRALEIIFHSRFTAYLPLHRSRSILKVGQDLLWRMYDCLPQVTRRHPDGSYQLAPPYAAISRRVVNAGGEDSTHRTCLLQCFPHTLQYLWSLHN